MKIDIRSTTCDKIIYSYECKMNIIKKTVVSAILYEQRSSNQLLGKSVFI